MKIRWKRLLAAPFVFLAAIVIIIEDWLWDDLARLAAAIGRLPVFRQIEVLIVSLPPYAALVTFGAPTLLLIPVKLLALWLIAHGQQALGLLTVVLAKFAGTALVARIFMLTRKNLLRIGWFAALHERVTIFRERVHTAIRNSRIYRTIHLASARLKIAVKEWLRNRRQGFWQRRWAAALKLSRRKQGD
ncbi:MAG TPA: hypothetical protein VNQ79_15480 [Blastocatellia bacterium]|nr:hypothetical protein [Blastocatellia bacterium]